MKVAFTSHTMYTSKANGVTATKKRETTHNMFTEIRGKHYLNEHAMTVLMADLLKEYAQVQENDGLLQLTDDTHADMDAKFIVESFKKKWRRPQDGSNGDLHAMYRSVSGGLQRAAQLEIRQRETLKAERHRQFLEALTNPQQVLDLDDDEWPDDDEWEAIYDDEDLF